MPGFIIGYTTLQITTQPNNKAGRSMMSCKLTN
jgi:hypothetical protein